MKPSAILRLATLVCAATIAVGALFMLKASPEASHIRTGAAAVSDLSSMARLCTLDIYEEVPIKGYAGTKHLVAIATLKASVTFNLDGVVPEADGDTLRLTLPPERVEVYESTEPEAYRVIDTWNEALLDHSKLTAAQENAIKAKAGENFRKSISRKGYVRRARKEAAANLTAMLSGMTGKTVVVSDPTPGGSYAD